MRQERYKPPSQTNRHPRRERTLLAGTILLALAAWAAPVHAAPAAPVITSPQTGDDLNDDPVTIIGTASGDTVLIQVFDGVTLQGTTGVTNGYWTIGLSLADGPHAIKARAKDGGGVFGPFSSVITFDVDTVNPPAPVITAPADGSLLPFSTITVEGTAEAGTSVRVEASTGAVLDTVAGPGGAWETTYTFTDTQHTIVARSTDAAGNTSLPSAAVTFRVDTVAPAAPQIYTPGPGAFTNDAPVSVAGSAEPGSTVKVFEGVTLLMTVSATDGTWSGLRFFAEGEHMISARAYDAAGHASPPSTRSFTVDFTPPAAPAITSPSSGAVLPHEYVVTGTSEPFATIQLLKTNTVVATRDADASGNWSIPQSAFSGQQQIKARARDRAGNTGPESAVITFVVDASPPPPPQVTTLDGTIFLPTQTPRIQGRASDDIGVLAVSLEYYDLLGRAYAIRNASCFACPAPTVDWHSDFAPLPGRYVVKVYSVDRAGNRSLPAKVTIVRL